MSEERYVGGTLKQVLILKGTCTVCPERADYRVTRANDCPPKGYISGGTMSADYCAEHLPVDAGGLVRSQL